MMKRNLEILIEDSFTMRAYVDRFREILPGFMKRMKKSLQGQSL